MTNRLGILTAVMSVVAGTLSSTLLGSPVSAVTPSPAVARAASSEGNTAALDYFLDAGDPAHTPARSFSRDDVSSLDKKLAPSQRLTSGHGSATASAQITASVSGFPSAITTVTVSGRISGSVSRSGKTEDVPVASSTSSFDLGFDGVNVPFVVTASGTASSNDGDECAFSAAVLTATTQDGTLDNVDLLGTGGGTCNPADGTLSYSGVLTSSGDIALDAEGTVDAEKSGSFSYAATYRLTVTFFAACDVLGSDTGEPLDGTPGDDVICGMGGADTIDGKGGNDTIFGGSDVDIIDAGPGDDQVFAGDGADQLQGNSGDDSLHGGAGDDVISDLTGPNVLLSGDDGDDAICGSQQKDTVDAGDGADFVLGFAGNDRLDLGAGDDTAKGLGTPTDALAVGCIAPGGTPGAADDDTILGGTGDDILDGDRGADTIKGQAGSDKLRGLDGSDLLVGGTRKDVLLGGPGGDTLNACDGVLDEVTGSGGSDTAFVDLGRDKVRSVEDRRAC